MSHCEPDTVDLEEEVRAIRKRDSDWQDGGRLDSASRAKRDRRALLKYIDEQSRLCEQVQFDVSQLRGMVQEFKKNLASRGGEP